MITKKSAFLSTFFKKILKKSVDRCAHLCDVRVIDKEKMPNQRSKNKTSITAYLNKNAVYDFNSICISAGLCRTDVLSCVINYFLNDITFQNYILKKTPESIYTKRNNNAKQAKSKQKSFRNSTQFRND